VDDRDTHAVRWRAIIAYDGTDYRGFQRQRAGIPTVQGELEAALEAISGGRRVKVAGAGRTDSGVHATGQVIAFDLIWRHGPERLQAALNANLPRDIAVLSVREAAPDFHPRFDAMKRTYHYQILNAPVRRPLWERTAWHVPEALDIDAMNRAAAPLIGVHDFRAFGQPHEKGGPTTREMFVATWTRETEQDYAVLRLDIRANAFLYRMVRRIAGALKAVGAGALDEESFLTSWQQGEWPQRCAAAPPQGVCLVSVDYDEGALSG
jgi:tRNA pseudouridine38-40 synthase